MVRIACSLALALAVATSRSHQPADACGAFIARSDGLRINDALQFVIVRDSTRTIMTVQNSYRGPSEDFALLIPVPVVLRKEDVATLDPKVFDAFEAVTGPLLSIARELDPCSDPADGVRATAGGGAPGGPAAGVAVEAQFAVGEYDVVVLSASESTALERWLSEQRYALPRQLGDRLRPYIEEGSKFFVARVDPRRLKFTGERAALSPLRFAYEAPDVRLPVRLSAASSPGVQEVLVYALRPQQTGQYVRMVAANRPNVTMPREVEITPAAARQFGSFYAALFNHIQRTTPDAVVTEFAGAPHVSPSVLTAVGASADDHQWGLTRLHFQVSRDRPLDDLVLRDAPTHEYVHAEFLVKEPWKGPISCGSPRRGRWETQPYAGAQSPRGAAPATAPVLDMIVGQVAELAIHGRGERSDERVAASRGCGCSSNGSPPLGLVAGVSLVGLRRRRHRHR